MTTAKVLELDITVISAKHLKNVNWRNGDLKPYAIFWLDPDQRLATKPDDAGSTRPVWNECFTLPITFPLHDSLLTLEIFHSKPSQTPKPFVGSLRFPLSHLVDSDESTHHRHKHPIKTLDLFRPSGRPQGKIRLKLSVREIFRTPPPDYHITPHTSRYYSTAPPPSSPPARDYREYSPSPSPSPYTTHAPPLPTQTPAILPETSSPYCCSSFSDRYSGYYPDYYSQSPPPPPLPRPFFNRSSSSNYAASGPSAPVELSSYDHKIDGSKAGAVAGSLGEERIKYAKEKLAEWVERDIPARDQRRDYRGGY